MNCVNCNRDIEFNQISLNSNFCLDCYHKYHEEKLNDLADRYYDEKGDFLEINGKELGELKTSEDIDELKQAQKDLSEYVNSEEGLKLIAKYLGKEWSKQMPNELKLIKEWLRYIEQQNYQSSQQISNR